MQPIYLVKVEAGLNANKYYKMIPEGDSFRVEYGRVGSNPQTDSYDISRWDSQLRSKLKKGYTDQTHLVAEVLSTQKSKEYAEIKLPSISEIVNRLQRLAKQAIEENYIISSNKVTRKMIEEAQDILNKISLTSNVEDFNSYLLTLFRVIPRKMKRVADNLASDKNDFSRIVQSEQDLLDTMKGQVVQQNTLNEEDNVDNNKQTILEVLGISFSDIDKKDEEIIKRSLGSSKDKFYKAWKVTNNKTQKMFDVYVKENKINNKKLLFHGSRSENFWSIINGGLVLRPNAIITGKMFGTGIYFSPDADKSLGYTSLSGSRWSNGNQNSGFMGLYDVAYGNPLDVYSFDNKYYNFTHSSLNGKNSLHAHGGTGMLRKDEIVIYKEEQSTIKYLVELK